MKFFDTSALLKGAVLVDGDYISAVVLKELEHIKSSATKDEETKYMAREALRKLRLVNYKVCLYTDKERERVIKKYGFLSDINDSIILGDAILLSSEIPVTLYTNDVLMFYFAQNCIKEIEAEFFEPVDSNKQLWDGWRKFTPTESEMLSLYTKKSINILQAKLNEYCKIYEGETLKDLFVWNGNEYEAVQYVSVQEPSPTRDKSRDRISPKNTEQKMAFNLLQNKKIKVKLLLGGYGSGKTFMALAHALHFLMKGDFQKIVYVRNNIEVKNTEKLGSLPGEEMDKLLPFLMPIADHCGGVEVLQDMIEGGQIEPIHLGFMRGRDIKRSIIFCDECENLTKEQVQLLIGRVAEGSELWLAGDLRQVDNRIFQENNGLRGLVNGLIGEELFGMVKLLKSERSATARLADKLD